MDGPRDNTCNVEIQEMSYEFLKTITDGFSEKKIIGSGTFGVVYKGILENGKRVAVKVLRDMAALDDKAFRDEFQNVAKLKHQNIVQLLGYCNESEETTVECIDGTKTPAEKIHRALCFEYIDNGSLQKYISDENQGLDWHIRFKIIKGICEGLKHIRFGMDKALWHLDLKPDNILLDGEMTPKIADFGIARLIIGDEKTRKTINCVGTCGYWPPEFVRFQFISEAFDIFSLGVIITKLMIGTKGYNECATMQPRQLVKHVYNNWKKKLQEGIELNALDVYCQQVKICIDIASKCLAEDRRQRPRIQDIVDTLSEAETMIVQHQVPKGESILPSSEGDDEASTKNNALINHLRTCPPCSLPFDKLKKITNNFSEDRLLGEGRFGRVYKGIFEDGHTVAVKVLKYAIEEDFSFQKTKSYITDVVRHKNVVQILETVMETREEATEHNGKIVLVKRTRVANCTEYFRNGSLDRYISDESDGLDWCTRYKIIKGICDGLRYLHEEVHILHVYLKPSNILLDENMVPKIGDLSMTRFLNVKETKRTISSFGTMEHLPPEFVTKQVISHEFDIYSLGVMIIKVVAGMSPHLLLQDRTSEEIIKRVLERWSTRLQATSKGRSLEGYCHQVKRCLEIAFECLETDMHQRPSIAAIVDMLDETETLIRDDSDLLDVYPMELCFLFRPKKHSSCLLRLNNDEDDSIAFRLLPNIPKRYLTQRSLCGVVPPRCTYTLALTTTKQTQRPPSEDSDDGFVLQGIAVGCYQEHKLHDLDQASAVKEYDSLFNKVCEIDGDKVQRVTLKCLCAPPADEASSKLTQQGIEINATMPAQKVLSIEVHPTKPWIMTTHEGGSLRVWNYQKMEEVLNAFDIPDEPVYVAKFIAREEWIVAGDDRGHIHIHSYDESQDTTSFEAHNGRIMSLAVHPTDSYVLSSSHDDHLIKLWHWDSYWNFDKDGWECLQTFNGHSARVSQVIFNPEDNGSFASASWDCTAKIWSLKSDVPNTSLDDNTDSILCIGYIFGDDRDHLITGSKNGTAQIWDIETKRLVETLRGHTNHISAVHAHRKHHILMTGSLDGTVRIWDSSTYRLENIIAFNLGEVHDFGYIDELQRIVVGCHQGIAVMEINSLKRQLPPMDDTRLCRLPFN